MNDSELCSRKISAETMRVLLVNRKGRWDKSLISEGSAVLENVSLSLGERAGVRASVLLN